MRTLILFTCNLKVIIDYKLLIVLCNSLNSFRVKSYDINRIFHFILASLFGSYMIICSFFLFYGVCVKAIRSKSNHNNQSFILAIWKTKNDTTLHKVPSLNSFFYCNCIISPFVTSIKFIFNCYTKQLKK